MKSNSSASTSCSTKLGRRGQLGAQQCDQVAVDLECIERAVAGFEQQAGECAAARADFHQAIVGARADRGNDVFEDRGVVQEVLAEALATRWPDSARARASVTRRDR